VLVLVDATVDVVVTIVLVVVGGGGVHSTSSLVTHVSASRQHTL
jgi:hypothetical protein